MSKVFTITEGLENMGALKTGGQGSIYKAKRTGPIITAVKLLPTPIFSEDPSDKNYRDFRNEVEKLKKVNSLDDYINILTTFYGYFAPVESKIEKYITPHQLPDIHSRKRSLFILSDLEKLGHLEPLNTTESLPRIDNDLQAAGALYVLEGSTLGGQHIARMLSAKPALRQREDIMSFFKGYEEQNDEMWQNFKEYLNTEITGEDVEMVVQSAIETFALLDMDFKKGQ